MNRIPLVHGHIWFKATLSEWNHKESPISAPSPVATCSYIDLWGSLGNSIAELKSITADHNLWKQPIQQFNAKGGVLNTKLSATILYLLTYLVEPHVSIYICSMLKTNAPKYTLFTKRSHNNYISVHQCIGTLVYLLFLNAFSVSVLSADSIVLQVNWILVASTSIVVLALATGNTLLNL